MAYKTEKQAILVKEINNDSVRKQIQNALPRHLDSNRIIRVIMTEVNKNPKLAECSKASFYGAILQASQLGLEIGSGLDRKSTRLNSSHSQQSRMPSSA